MDTASTSITTDRWPPFYGVTMVGSLLPHCSMDPEIKKEFSVVREDLRNLNGRVRRIDGRVGDLDPRLSAEIQQVETALRQEIREEGITTRRHFDVVAESLRDDIRIIAEGLIALGTKVEAMGRRDSLFTENDARCSLCALWFCPGGSIKVAVLAAMIALSILVPQPSAQKPADTREAHCAAARAAAGAEYAALYDRFAEVCNPAQAPQRGGGGLNPATMKYLIISHGHGDHHGGAKYLQDEFGPRVVMGAPDWDLVAKNQRDPIPRRDITASDAQKITLGDTTVVEEAGRVTLAAAAR